MKNLVAKKVGKGAKSALSCLGDRGEALQKLVNNGQAGHADEVVCVRFSPDSSRLVTTSKDNTAMLWKSSSGECTASLIGHTQTVCVAAFSRCGRFVATGSEDGTAKVWVVRTGELQATLAGNVLAAKQAFESATKKRHRAPVKSLLSIEFSADAEKVLAATDDGTAKIWCVETTQVLVTLSAHKVVSCGFDPTSQRVVTAGDKTARISLTNSGSVQTVLSGHKDNVLTARFSPDGLRVVTASKDKTAIVWNVLTGASERTLSGHDKWVLFADFSPDGKHIATGSLDETVKVWETKTGKTVKSWQQKRCVDFVRFSSTSAHVVTACGGKTAKIWSLDDTHKSMSLQRHRGKVTWAEFSPCGKFVVTSSQDASAMTHNADCGTVWKVMKKLSHYEKSEKWIKIFMLFPQVVKFAMSERFPWNPEMVKPVLVTTDLFSFDIGNSKVYFLLFKLCLALFMAIFFSFGALSGAITCKEGKVWHIMVKGVYYSFVPILTLFTQVFRCAFVHHHFGMECHSYEHIWLMTAVALVTPLFVGTQLPYLVVDGDESALSEKDVRNPKRWAKAVTTKNSQRDIGFFKQAVSRGENERFSPSILGAFSELLMKVALPVASVAHHWPASIIVCLVAVFQRLVVQLAYPLYVHRAANVVLVGAQLAIFFAYCMGFGLMLTEWLSSGNTKVELRHYSWPTICLYLGTLVIVFATFLAMLRASLDEVEGNVTKGSVWGLELVSRRRRPQMDEDDDSEDHSEDDMECGDKSLSMPVFSGKSAPNRWNAASKTDIESNDKSMSMPLTPGSAIRKSLPERPKAVVDGLPEPPGLRSLK